MNAAVKLKIGFMVCITVVIKKSWNFNGDWKKAFTFSKSRMIKSIFTLEMFVIWQSLTTVTNIVSDENVKQKSVSNF